MGGERKLNSAIKYRKQNQYKKYYPANNPIYKVF